MSSDVTIHILQEDITCLNVDAIVNAANRSLLGGGGVDGAIHRAAGPELLAECEKLNGCETGKAKITLGYRLKAKYVIHTVGPVWNGGAYSEAQLLAGCYNNCLALAEQNKLSSIAFPNISTGIYRFPKDYASQIAFKSVIDVLSELKYLKNIYFVCFDDENFQLYKAMHNQCSLKI